MKLYLLCFLFFFKPFVYANKNAEKTVSNNNKIRDGILSIYKWDKKIAFTSTQIYNYIKMN